MKNIGSTDSHMIAVTGGIGSGKSTVCEILRAMGYPVYDCDSRAKEIMDIDLEMHRRIAAEISPDIVLKDTLDRKRLGEIVFQTPEKLRILNDIVHTSVKNDITSWKAGKRICFVETAILYQSGIDRMVDSVWDVEAPEYLRIRRVMERNHLTETEVKRRIESQRMATVHPHPYIYTILNDDMTPILPRIEELISILN